MILEVRAVPPFYKNGFLVGCERTHEAVVIDPGDEADELLAAVRDRGVDVTHILLTHAHIDHITGVAQVKEALTYRFTSTRTTCRCTNTRSSRGRYSGSRSASRRRSTSTTT